MIPHLIEHMKINAVLMPLILILLSCLSPQPDPPTKQHKILINAETKTLPDGDEYTFFHPLNSSIEFVTKRPDSKDTSITFCVAAAFTNLKDFKIDGLYLEKGERHHFDRINYTLGGAYYNHGSGPKLISTNKGLDLSDSLLNLFEADSVSLFQQILMVIDGKPETFKYEKHFQRRALVTTETGEYYIVENTQPKTLHDFCNGLVELDNDAKNALYLDMGGWDEGWYRYSSDSIVVIGSDRSATAFQSNWIVYKTN